MNISELNKIARQMVAPGKGILAADESTGTIGKRFDKISLENTEPNRRAWREVLFTTKGAGQYISGVIMFEETIRQSTAPPSSPPYQGGDRGGGRTFISVLEEAGVLPGIKVDQGTTSDPSSPDEKFTQGLEGLPDRLKEYAQLGAKFAKWRAVITIDESKNLPTNANIRQNAKDLAQYAKDCQKAGLVPMVEPEVLMDGGHDISKCAEVTKKTLKYLFEELENLGVEVEGTILKTNMVLPGKEAEKASPAEIAKATVEMFKTVLPDNLPGVAFLSGGQSEIEATENLNEMNKIYKDLLWQLSFSYGRALQDSALKMWNGRAENVKAAQEKFLYRAKMNSLARDGKYSSKLESSKQ